MRFGIHRHNDTGHASQQPGRDVSKHKSDPRQHKARQSNCNIRYRPTVLGSRFCQQFKVLVVLAIIYALTRAED